MKQFLLLTCYMLCKFALIAQHESAFNLDFEAIENNMPTHWRTYGDDNYKITIDSTVVKNNKYAIAIEFSEGDPGYKVITFSVPENYDGKKITLKGYLKTENVSEGYATMWMRIDPDIAFGNIKEKKIRGSSDWQEYEVSLDMKPKKSKYISIGIMLRGKGKIWADKLTLSIDGKRIELLEPIESNLLPAEKDKEFSKGSFIDTIPTDAKTLEDLKLLGMVWGFVKYNHPNIAKGLHNWDYELFRVLPKILKTKSTAERDRVMVNWIKNLGAFKSADQAAVDSGRVKLYPDLDWLDNSELSSELSSLLHNMYNAKKEKEHFYIGTVKGVGNPKFKNESAYSSMNYPDVGFRLLAVYRYWNMIQYYFPYRHLIEEDWKDILGEFIPMVINAQDRTAYHVCMLKLIGRVHDTHASLSNSVIQKYQGANTSAAELTFIEEKPVVTGFYDYVLGKETGLEIGDLILSVNGKSIESIIKERQATTPASNHPTRLRNIALYLLNTNDSTIDIEYLRNGEKTKTLLKTYPSKQFKLYRKFYGTGDTSFVMLDKKIAYIDNSLLKKTHLSKIWPSIQKTKGLIVDLRNYPTDFPIYALGGYLVPKSTPFVKFTRGSIIHPGLFTFGKVPNSVGQKKRKNYKGKVILLINEITQSSSEFHAMAYRQAPKATVVGSTTAGADGNVSRIVLPGYLVTAISGIGVYYPNGYETQRIGILPDVEVKPTIKGIKEGRDELLEKAIELIKN